MNFLQLCQRLDLEIGAGSGDIGTNPPTAVGQTGQNLRLVTWIQQAYSEIQSAQKAWLWMHLESDGDITLAAGGSDVALSGLATLDKVLPYISDGKPHILLYQTTAGATDAQPVWLYAWQEFSGFFDSGRYANSSGRPTICALSPDNKIAFHVKADVAYKVKLNYKIKHHSLSANIDVPLLPEKYHMLIVYLALCYYGRSKEANSIASWLGNGLKDRRVPTSPLCQIYQNMCNEELPPITWFGEL